MSSQPLEKRLKQKKKRRGPDGRIIRSHRDSGVEDQLKETGGSVGHVTPAKSRPEKEEDDSSHDTLEKSTDRELFKDMKDGQFKDPRTMSARERELLTMSKAQLIDIILRFEKKYGRNTLVMDLMGGWGDSDEEDANEKHEEFRVRNLDTGTDHGEESIDRFMADPRVVKMSKAIRNLDDGTTITAEKADVLIPPPGRYISPQKAKKKKNWLGGLKKKLGGDNNDAAPRLPPERQQLYY